MPFQSIPIGKARTNLKSLVWLNCHAWKLNLLQSPFSSPVFSPFSLAPILLVFAEVRAHSWFHWNTRNRIESWMAAKVLVQCRRCIGQQQLRKKTFGGSLLKYSLLRSYLQITVPPRTKYRRGHSPANLWLEYWIISRISRQCFWWCNRWTQELTGSNDWSCWSKRIAPNIDTFVWICVPKDQSVGGNRMSPNSQPSGPVETLRNSSPGSGRHFQT